jgi:uncharacterized protein (TIGR00299 family) protein
MRALYLDLSSGIGGDMMVAALGQLGFSLEPLRQALDAMGLAAVRLRLEPVERSGIEARRFTVEAPGEDRAERCYADIRTLLGRSGLSGGARERAEAMFARLAEAEAHVHGTSPDAVHFHEVGAADSIADIVGCALALEALAPERILASTPAVGWGVVQSRHGPLPLPAPATVELLRGIRVRHLDLEGELITPTGAAILATQVQRFGEPVEIAVEKVGYGAGTRTFPGRPNLLRLLWGEDGGGPAEELLLEANIDDMNPQAFEHLMERLLAEGALDVWLQPVIMKKSRPGVVLALLCPAARAPALEEIVFAESTTIGLRRQAVERARLERNSFEVDTPFGRVRVKAARRSGRLLRLTPEYEDCRNRARAAGVSLLTVMEAARAAANASPEKDR